MIALPFNAHDRASPSELLRRQAGLVLFPGDRESSGTEPPPGRLLSTGGKLALL